MKNFLARGLGLIALAAIGASRPPVLTGVITQIAGTVQVYGSGTRGLPIASPWQVVQAGVKVKVPPMGSAGIACSNLRFVRLAGPASWLLSEETCAQGKELTPGEYALVAPQAGRFRVVEGIMVIEREIRTEDLSDPLAPLVLAPRNSTVRSPRPTIFWSRVSSATEYEIRWTGRGVERPRTLRADAVNCSEVREGLSTCTLPWPTDRAELSPGETFYLTISARSGLSEPWHYNEPVKVETQPLVAARELESQLGDLDRLGLDEPALATARASLLAKLGLLSDAAELYRAALGAQLSPELRITLADLQFAMGLHFLSEKGYREALGDAKPMGRAAAKFGLGRVAYARDDFRGAEKSFHEAAEVYTALGFAEESKASRRAESKAKTKVQESAAARDISDQPGSPVSTKEAQ